MRAAVILKRHFLSKAAMSPSCNAASAPRSCGRLCGLHSSSGYVVQLPSAGSCSRAQCWGHGGAPRGASGSCLSAFGAQPSRCPELLVPHGTTLIFIDFPSLVAGPPAVAWVEVRVVVAFVVAAGVLPIEQNAAPSPLRGEVGVWQMPRVSSHAAGVVVAWRLWLGVIDPQTRVGVSGEEPGEAGEALCVGDAALAVMGTV